MEKENKRLKGISTELHQTLQTRSKLYQERLENYINNIKVCCIEKSFHSFANFSIF